jgi:hypothetical protein
VFAHFAEMGSARRVWLWCRSQALKFPLQMHARAEIRWVEASYTAIHQVLTNPVYAGAYVYGKTRQETILDASGARKKRIRYLPRSQWQVLIPEHHPGFIDWQTYEANLAIGLAPNGLRLAALAKSHSILFSKLDLAGSGISRFPCNPAP